jgi:hypothetical protein
MLSLCNQSPIRPRQGIRPRWFESLGSIDTCTVNCHSRDEKTFTERVTRWESTSNSPPIYISRRNYLLLQCFILFLFLIWFHKQLRNKPIYMSCQYVLLRMHAPNATSYLVLNWLPSWILVDLLDACAFSSLLCICGPGATESKIICFFCGAADD